MAVRPRIWLVLLSILAGASLTLAQEQAATEETPADESAETISTGEQQIDVGFGVRDEQIAERIRAVLDATKQVRGLSVSVQDGVVVLRGEVDKQESKELAAQLARRTEGVAAVVNSITIKQEPLWTLAPAKRELSVITREIVRSLPLVAIGAVVLLISLLVAGGVSRLATRLIARSDTSELLQNVLRRVIFFGVILLGVYFFLRISGLTRVAITIVSGTGLIGLVLGFAFRDIAENFLASLLLSIQRPFQLGDVIEVDGHTGVVQKVTTRGTLLIDFDGNHIQIANSKVYKSNIKNFTANPNMRAQFTVGVGYDDDLEEAQDVLRCMLDEHQAVLKDPAPLVLVEELGSSTVNLYVYFWIDGSTHSVLKVKSSVIRHAVAALTEAGVSMPDEAREVIFPKGVPVLMEGDGGPSSARPQSAEKRGPSESEKAKPPKGEPELATTAEGDFVTETHDLEEQARQSRDPDEAPNVLKEGPGKAG